MTRQSLRRGALLGALAIAGVGVFATPVAAQSTTRNLIMGLNRDLLILAVPIAIFMEGLLIYTVYRFRNNDDAKPTTENRTLEISWTVATALILLFVGFASYQVLAQPAVTGTTPNQHAPSDAVVVNVTGEQFLWTFHYPSANVTNQSTMVIPVNRTIYFQIQSKDVIHSMYIPALAIKQDAIPGKLNTYQTKATQKGTYQLYCAEYCGQGHSKMLAKVKVVDNATYQQWLKDQQASAQGGQGGNSSSGGSSGGSGGSGSGNQSGNGTANQTTTTANASVAVADGGR